MRKLIDRLFRGGRAMPVSSAPPAPEAPPTPGAVSMDALDRAFERRRTVNAQVCAAAGEVRKTVSGVMPTAEQALAFRVALAGRGAHPSGAHKAAK